MSLCHDTLVSLGKKVGQLARESKTPTEALMFKGIESEVWMALQQHLAEVKHLEQKK
jgi:hypothetical protein